MHTRHLVTAVIAVFLVLLGVQGAFAQSTTSFPDYPGQTLLTPASQAPTAWTNVIPNALAAYYTYTPYTDAAAVAIQGSTRARRISARRSTAAVRCSPMVRIWYGQ